MLNLTHWNSRTVKNYKFTIGFSWQDCFRYTIFVIPVIAHWCTCTKQLPCHLSLNIQSSRLADIIQRAEYFRLKNNLYINIVTSKIVQPYWNRMLAATGYPKWAEDMINIGMDTQPNFMHLGLGCLHEACSPSYD